MRSMAGISVSMVVLDEGTICPTLNERVEVILAILC
jgi:hypothetical protein